MDTEAKKRRAGKAAAESVEDGAVVGLGSGSTAAAAIRALGQRVDAGLDITGVPTSYQAQMVAKDVGIQMTDPADVQSIDVAIDGADQVGDTAILKGGGASHAREKLIASAADRVLIVIDDTKQADQLDQPVPIELLPAARSILPDSLRSMGADPTLRDATGKSGPVITDNGNLVIDADFGIIDTPDALAEQIASLPGVIEHGLFVDMVDTIYVGEDEGMSVYSAE